MPEPLAKRWFKFRWDEESSKIPSVEFGVVIRDEIARVVLFQMLRSAPDVAVDAVIKVIYDGDVPEGTRKKLLDAAEPFMDDCTQARHGLVDRKARKEFTRSPRVESLGGVLAPEDATMQMVVDGTIKEPPGKIFVAVVNDYERGEGDEPDEINMGIVGYTKDGGIPHGVAMSLLAKLEAGGFECQGGLLENNIAFVELKEVLSGKLPEGVVGDK